MTTIRERLAALPKSAKIAGGLVGAAVVGLGGWALWPKKKRKHAEHTVTPAPEHAAHGEGHPTRVLLVHPQRHYHRRHPEADLAVRRDIARLLEDVRRAKRGEPPLAGATGDKEADIAKLSFELGAYVAEALMARGIVIQMPDVPKSSAITDSMTEEAGEAAFQTLASAANGPLNMEGMSALNDIKASSGVKFWAEPSAIESVAAEVAEINASKEAP